MSNKRIYNMKAHLKKIKDKFNKSDRRKHGIKNLKYAGKLKDTSIEIKETV